MEPKRGNDHNNNKRPEGDRPKNSFFTPLMIALVLVLIMVINAGYGGGFANVPPLLSDHYGMGSISALHGITLSAWAFAGLSGNQLATWIVNNFGQVVEIDGHMVNPAGYQMVLYVTAALYLVALLLSIVFVRPMSHDRKAA
jgi:OFA family oxalate/formate antiporter-like MFS transporter